VRCSGLVVPLDAQLTDRSTPARPEPPARHHPRALADSRNRSARRRPLLSDEAVEPGDRFGHAFMIRADYRTQILRVEFGRERSRADEVNVTVSWNSRRHLDELTRSRIARSNLRRSPSSTPRSLRCWSVRSGRTLRSNAIFGKTLSVLGHAEFLERRQPPDLWQCLPAFTSLAPIQCRALCWTRPMPSPHVRCAWRRLRGRGG